MSIRCPGCLNAKSLLSGGICREDYIEWFFNSELSAHRVLIDTVYRTIQYRGDAPVLLICDISTESCLLFRFSMELRDLKGRPHQRCEVLKIDSEKLPRLLDGKFNADPKQDAKEFVVDAAGGKMLPERECHRVGNTNLRVFAQDIDAYWFTKEKSEVDAPFKQTPVGEPKRRIQEIQNEVPAKNRVKIMSKILLLILIVVCALGGWYYVQCEELRSRMDVQNDEMAKCRAEMSSLRKENSRLLGEINKYDKWIKARGNFELNKVQLEIKLNEIKEKFKEAELLMQRIDETPKRQPSKAKKKALGGTAIPNADTTLGGSSVEPSDGNTAGGKRSQGVFNSIKETISDLVP